MKRLNPTSDTIKMLLLRSGNRCYFPNCSHAIFNNKDTLIAECCHIEAAMPGGERFNSAQSEEERRSIDNLLFLCHQHHVETDDVNVYSVEKLKAIKQEHENKFRENNVQINTNQISEVICSIEQVLSTVKQTHNTVTKLDEKQNLIIDFLASQQTKKAVKVYDDLPLTRDEVKRQLKIASSELYFIDNNFHIPESHINRKETKELYDWIIAERPPVEEKCDEKSYPNVLILTGNAGMGKTVILKDLLDVLISKDIPVLGLKADKKKLSIDSVEKSLLESDISITNLFYQLTLQHQFVVLLVDQIDALSQSLSINREQIKAYTSLINKLATIDRVKIVISCRKFDLEYDPEFTQFRHNKKIQVDLLSVEEVNLVLQRLTKKKGLVFPSNLIELLRTPLHLDVFCRIYDEHISLNEIKNLQDLYRGLWNKKIKQIDRTSPLKVTVLEDVLFKVASEIYKRQDNLCVPVVLFDNYFHEIQYLKSESLLIEDNGYILFFHQSFYDYTFARNFIEKEKYELYNFLIELEHQGLFIRSMVKQIISYLRLYNPKEYNRQLNNILFSDKIRFHIKHLIINYLSFEENPTTDEFKIILRIIEEIPPLAVSFFFMIPNINWHNIFLEEKDLMTELINQDSRLGTAIERFIVFSVNNNIEETFQILQSIKDETKRYQTIDWTLIRVCDFSNPITTNLYDLLELNYLKDDTERFHILDQAISSNPDFAMSKAKKVFLGNFLKEKPKYRFIYSESNTGHFTDFLEKLYLHHPLKAYCFAKDIINVLVDNTILEYYINLNLQMDYTFENYDAQSNNIHKLMKVCVEYLKQSKENDFEFVRNEISSYLKSTKATDYLIALQTIVSIPSSFLKESFDIICNDKLWASFFHNPDLKYYARKLLHDAYPLFSIKQQNEINEFILSFQTKIDLSPSKDYLVDRKKYGTHQKHTKFYPFYFWRLNQRTLLHSIPLDCIKKNDVLRKRKSELDRRFSGDSYTCDNKSPYHGVIAAGFSGGITSISNYSKLTICQWNKSFIRYEKHSDADRRNRFDLDAHARAFKDVIKTDPDKFSQFVSDLIFSSDIHPRYLINGLEGLMLGGYSNHMILQLYAKLCRENIEEHEQYHLLHIGEHLIKNNCLNDEIIKYWKSFMFLPLPKGSVYYDNSDKKDVLFRRGHNSISASSIRLLIKLSSIEKYNDSVYEYLMKISSDLPINLRLVVLYKINQENHFSINQLLNIFLSYSFEESAEFCYVARDIINYLFFHRFNDIIPFIHKIKSLDNTSEFLGTYLFYAWLYNHETSKKILLDTHSKYPESIIATIEQACRYLEDNEYKDRCLYILNLYLKDTSKEVRKAYLHGFCGLDIKNFKDVYPIIKEFVNDKDDEGQLYDLYRYLIKCAEKYYIDCIEILKQINFSKGIKSRREIEMPIKILTICYNAIKKYNKPDIQLEYVMDVFDYLLQYVNYDTNIERILSKLDEE